MEKILNRQFSLRTILLMTFVVIFITTATATTVTTIQATIATNITVKLDGEVQNMRDANGQVVYPISYQGTTYLPVRAVSNMLGLPVDWDSETNTVILGKPISPGKSLFDVATLSGNQWDKYTHVDDFPSKLDDFENKLPNDYSFAYRSTTITSAGNRNGTLTFTGSYNYVSFTLARVDTDYRDMKFRLIDDDTKTIIYESNIISGQFIDVVDLKITGIKKLTIQATGVYSTSHWHNGVLFMLNPMVK